MPARRCTLYCFLFERRGLGPLAPHSPAFVSQDTPLHQRHLALSLIFSLPLFFCGESHKREVVCCRCGRLPRWAGGMAALLIDRLPGAPLWGGRGVGGQKALPHAATPQHKHRPHGNAYRGPSLFHASSSAGFYLPSSSLSLWLFSWSSKDCFHSFVCLNCWCRSAALIAWSFGGEGEIGMGGWRRDGEIERLRFFGEGKDSGLASSFLSRPEGDHLGHLTSLSPSQWGGTRPIVQSGHRTCDRSGQQKLSDSSVPAGRLSFLRPAAWAV